MNAQRLILIVFISCIVLSVALFYRNFHVIDYNPGRYLEIDEIKSTGIKAIRSPYPNENLASTVNLETIDGTSILAFNPVTSETYFKRNINDERPIASITKLMTTLVALDLYDLNDLITLTQTVSIPDRSLNLEVGDKVRVKELLEAMLISSKNDAAEILAQEYGYKAFIKKMNEKAAFLGMKDSHFSNTSGYYDKNNYSTAHDLRILATAVIKSGFVDKIVKRSSGTFVYERRGVDKSVNLVTTNELLGVVSNTVGLKTGYTIRSGPSFIGYFVSSDTDQVVTIILNSSDRFEETRQLLNLVQQSFKAD